MSFIEEFNKFAAAVAADASLPEVSTYSSFQKRLRVGDILVATPKPPPKGQSIIARGVGAITGAVMRKFQGDYTHASMYTGKGAISEIRLGAAATTKSLKDALKGLNVRVVRPQVPTKVRTLAVRRMRKMVDDGATYNPQMLLEAGAANFMRIRGKSLKERLDKNKVICSNMVTRAYKGVRFDKHKDPELMMPSDFLKSHKVKQVMLFKNPTKTAD